MREIERERRHNNENIKYFDKIKKIMTDNNMRQVDILKSRAILSYII